MLALIAALALMQPNAPGVVTVAQGTHSGIDARTETFVRTASDWQALWKTHGGNGPAPEVDFAREMVAAVFIGTRPTGGFGVSIVGARREGDALIVEYSEQRPPADAIVTQALTSPFHIVRLPRHDGRSSFRNTTPAAAGR